MEFSFVPQTFFNIFFQDQNHNFLWILVPELHFIYRRHAMNFFWIR